MARAPEWLTLDPGEEVVWAGQPRVRRILSTVARAVVWSVVGVAAAYVLAAVVDVPLPVGDPVVWAVAALYVLVQAANPVTAYLRTRNTDYLLTDGSVYKKTGVFSETVTRVAIDRIQNTTLRKDFLGNTFDYGTVLLSTAGGSGVEMALEDLDDPEAFRDDLRALMAAAGGRETAGDAGLEPERLQRVLEEARLLRESAESIERTLR
jgi:uncharacterized membrane protein YdbT with pleckstrin-like domain